MQDTKIDLLLAEMRKLNAALERQILSCPGQYLWGYDRYKTPAGVPGPETESL